MSLGLERTNGFQTTAFCEIEPYCRRVLAKHWPSVPIHTDIKQLDGRQYTGAIDVICLEIMPDVAASSIDSVIVDLPYGTTSNKWDSPIPFPELWNHYLRLGKPSATFIFTASQPFTSALVMSKPDLFRHEWIWIKNRGSNFANTVREPMKEHESVLVFSRGKWTYNRQMQERTGTGGDRVKYQVAFRSHSENYQEFEGRDHQQVPELRVPSSWQKFNTEVGYHPTQKPVALMEYLIKTYTNPGDVVLDNTMGSGTTGVACAMLGRKFIGIEQDAEYVAIAETRIRAAAGMKVAPKSPKQETADEPQLSLGV